MLLLHQQNPRSKISSPGPVTHTGRAASGSLKSTTAVPWTTRATKKNPSHQCQCYATCTRHREILASQQRDCTRHQTVTFHFNVLNQRIRRGGRVFESFYIRKLFLRFPTIQGQFSWQNCLGTLMPRLKCSLLANCKYYYFFLYILCSIKMNKQWGTVPENVAWTHLKKWGLQLRNRWNLWVPQKVKTHFQLLRPCTKKKMKMVKGKLLDASKEQSCVGRCGNYLSEAKPTYLPLAKS